MVTTGHQRTSATRVTRRFARAALLALSLSLAAVASASAGTPTCSDTLGIAVHGQHVIGKYVTGTGASWPPSGAVGQAVQGAGAAISGGPGPGFHFPNGVAPGASFCNSQAQSPGYHAP